MKRLLLLYICLISWLSAAQISITIDNATGNPENAPIRIPQGALHQITLAFQTDSENELLAEDTSITLELFAPGDTVNPITGSTVTLWARNTGPANYTASLDMRQPVLAALNLRTIYGRIRYTEPSESEVVLPLHHVLLSAGGLPVNEIDTIRWEQIENPPEFTSTVAAADITDATATGIAAITAPDAAALAAAAGLANAASTYGLINVRNRIAYVDPIAGSDVDGEIGRIDLPYATVSAARDGLLADYTPSESEPVTIKTVGAQTIPVASGLITEGGFILDLRDGSVLQSASGNMITLGSGEHVQILGGGLTAAGGSYVIVNNGGSFEVVDSYIVGSFASGSSIVAISHNSVNAGTLDRCVVDGQIWSIGRLQITDCNIYGSLQFRPGDHDFEVWDTRIAATGSVVYGSQVGAVYFPDGGTARTIRGLLRNVYITSPDASSYPIISNFSNGANTVELSLQRCNAYSGGSKIVHSAGTYDLRLEGDVLYGNLASIGDGTLDGLAYDGDTARTW